MAQNRDANGLAGAGRERTHQLKGKGLVKINDDGIEAFFSLGEVLDALRVQRRFGFDLKGIEGAAQDYLEAKILSQKQAT